MSKAPQQELDVFAQLPPSNSLDEVALYFSGAINFDPATAQTSAADKTRAGKSKWNEPYNSAAKLQPWYEKAQRLGTQTWTQIINANMTNWTPTQTVYYKMRGLYNGNGEQYFCLNFPTQPLNRDDYAFDTSLGNTQTNKPTSVAEKEFLLADGIFPMAPIVTGPTGDSLANTWFRALNNLVPKFDVEVQLSSAQHQIQDYLTQPRPVANGTTALVKSNTTSAVYGQKSNQRLITDGNTAEDSTEDTQVATRTQNSTVITKPVNGTAAVNGKKPANGTYDDDDDNAIDIPLQRFQITTAAYAAKKRDVQLTRSDELMAIDPRNVKQMEMYLRKVAFNSEAENFDLESAYLVAVLKGRYHHVRNMASYMDIMTIGEQMMETKATCRNSRSMMTDQSGYKYPVNFTPSNWADNLRTDFMPEDLLQDPDVIASQLLAANSQLLKLNRQLATLAKLNSDPNYAELEQNVTAARQANATAMDALSNAYLASTVLAIKTAVAAYTSGGTSFLFSAAGSALKDAVSKDTKAGNSTAAAGLIDDFGKSYAAVQKATTDMLQKSAEYVEALRKRGEATVNDRNLQITQLQLQISDQQATVNELQAKLTMANASKEKKSADPGSDPVQVALDALMAVSEYKTADDAVKTAQAEADAADKALAGKTEDPSLKTAADDKAKALMDKIKALKDLQSGQAKPQYKAWQDAISAQQAKLLPSGFDPASLWTSVVMTQKMSLSTATTASQSSASQSSWHVNFFFGSAGGSNSDEQSSANDNMNDKSLSITIAYQAMKVDINRPGWFSPELMRESGQFQHISPKLKFQNKQNANILAEPPIFDPNENVVKPETDGLMPCYATALILCKDVVISITGDEATRSSIKAHAASSSSAGGGCFGFSYNRSSSNKSDSSDTIAFSDSKTTTIKIPGPQIIGYLMQKTPIDDSTDMSATNKLPADVFY